MSSIGGYSFTIRKKLVSRIGGLPRQGVGEVGMSLGCKMAAAAIYVYDRYTLRKGLKRNSVRGNMAGR